MIVSACRISPSAERLSPRQRRVQVRVRGLDFKAAVCLSTDTLFRFTHRGTRASALWSENVRAWLGKKTFLHWAMNEVHVGIPRVVTQSVGAPEDENELRKAVHGELTAYWEGCLASLPAKSMPRWLPLP